MEKIKNIYYKALKLINDLKLTNEVDITVCFAKENKDAFYFVIETEKLEHYCFSLDRWFNVLSPKISGLFLKDYDDLEKAILNFIKKFNH